MHIGSHANAFELKHIAWWKLIDFGNDYMRNDITVLVLTVKQLSKGTERWIYPLMHSGVIVNHTLVH